MVLENQLRSISAQYLGSSTSTLILATGIPTYVTIIKVQCIKAQEKDSDCQPTTHVTYRSPYRYHIDSKDTADAVNFPIKSQMRPIDIRYVPGVNSQDPSPKRKATIKKIQELAGAMQIAAEWISKHCAPHSKILIFTNSKSLCQKLKQQYPHCWSASTIAKETRHNQSESIESQVTYMYLETT